MNFNNFMYSFIQDNILLNYESNYLVYLVYLTVISVEYNQAFWNHYLSSCESNIFENTFLCLREIWQ